MNPDLTPTELERLVAFIERILSSHGAVVKSPDHIKDRDTGVDREVDVSIRVTSGSSQVLTIIECRKRKSKQDVRWIEELASKRTSVSADIAIAVSWSGFSEGALAKARALGVRTRVLSQVTEQEVKKWADPKTAPMLVSRTETRWRAKELGFSADGSAQVRVPGGFDEGGNELGLDVPLLQDSTTGKTLTLRQFGAEIVDKAIAEDREGRFPVDGAFHEAQLLIEFSEPRYTVVGDPENRQIRLIYFLAEVIRTDLQVAVSVLDAREYFGEGPYGARVLHVGTPPFELGDQDLRMVMQFVQCINRDGEIVSLPDEELKKLLSTPPPQSPSAPR